MSGINQQMGWKSYTAKALAAEFDLTAKELSAFAEAGLILAPAARHKGPPYTEMDHLRLSVFKRCTQAGYGLDEVLDLIGRIHRRTAPIKTIILAKAFANDKLNDLEAQMSEGDALAQVNLRCDADILRTYIDDLTQMQRRMGEATGPSPTPVAPPDALNRDGHQSPNKPPVSRPPEPKASPATGPKAQSAIGAQERGSAPRAAQVPRRQKVPPQTKRRPNSKLSYPRPYGSLAEESRQLWKHATPGGRLGWAAILLIALVVGGSYLYYSRSDVGSLLPPGSGPVSETSEESPLDVEEMPSIDGGTDKAAPAAKDTATAPVAKAPSQDTKTKAAAKKRKGTSLTATAVTDLEKIMAANGKTVAASGDAPPMIKVNELVALYDTKTRVLRVKIELLKNLAGGAPPTVNGRIFVTLKPVGDEDPQGVITLPRIPLSAHKMADFSKHGVAFSLEDQKTSYIKTQLSKQPPIQQQLTIYIFDAQQNLLHHEKTIIRVKIV